MSDDEKKSSEPFSRDANLNAFIEHFSLGHKFVFERDANRFSIFAVPLEREDASCIFVIRDIEQEP